MSLQYISDYGNLKFPLTNNGTKRNWPFLLFHWRYLEMFIEQSSTFHMNFVQIAEFDWLPGRHKRLLFVKIFKSPLLRNQTGRSRYFAYI